MLSWISEVIITGYKIKCVTLRGLKTIKFLIFIYLFIIIICDLSFYLKVIFEELAFISFLETKLGVYMIIKLEYSYKTNGFCPNNAILSWIGFAILLLLWYENYDASIQLTPLFATWYQSK